MDLKNQIQKREIKFRALKDDMSNCNFVYGQLVYDAIGCPRITEIDSSGQGLKFHTCIKGTEGQYTGLQDKAGKGNDVYEGDTFEAIYKDCPDGYSIMGKDTTVIRIKATVVFKWGGFMVEMMHPVEKKLVYSRLADFLENEEKIVNGNIYENKT
mgnify:FL=1